MIGIIGLGFVGLPLALAFAEKFRVIAYDKLTERVAELSRGYDRSGEVDAAAFEGLSITFTDTVGELAPVDFYIVAVPTPVDQQKVPDLSALYEASDSIGRLLRRGDFVVYESTVFPGCTEEECLPVLEARSGLRCGTDFSLGYSPERINPGDSSRSLVDITKIVAGDSPTATSVISEVYRRVLSASVYEAPSIKVAEAAKVIENTQRDLNISFFNELAIIFDRLGLDTLEVIEAAATKWNFIAMRPGLVGGHCIGVDPYYLLHRAKKAGYDPQVILSGRRINDGMPAFVAKKITQTLLGAQITLRDSHLLVLGCTFKENVSDVRNSKVFELVEELMDYQIRISLHDPLADAQLVDRLHQMALVDPIPGHYDGIVVPVAHTAFKNFGLDFFRSLIKPGRRLALFDLKGIYSRNQLAQDELYWRL